MTTTFKVLAFAFLVTLFGVSAAFAGPSSEQGLPTPDMGRTYHFFDYLANGVPTDGYNASPYLPKGMNGIGVEAATKIWNEARKEYSGSDVSILVSATLQAASKLYGEHSTTYSSVKNAWTALNLNAAGSITVTNPKGGETWQLRTKYTIKWAYSAPPGPNVAIFTEFKVGNFWYFLFPITNSTSIGSSGTGSYVWNVPCNEPLAETRIVIYSTVDNTYKAVSNSFYFADPNPPTITVTSPVTSATWKEGTTHAIKWTYTGNPGTSVKISLVDTNPYHPLGLTLTNSTSMGSSGSGSFSWTIPTNLYPDNKYYIAVKSNTYSCYEAASGFFTITAP